MSPKLRISASRANDAESRGPVTDEGKRIAALKSWPWPTGVACGSGASKKPNTPRKPADATLRQIKSEIALTTGETPITHLARTFRALAHESQVLISSTLRDALLPRIHACAGLRHSSATLREHQRDQTRQARRDRNRPSIIEISKENSCSFVAKLSSRATTCAPGEGQSPDTKFPNKVNLTSENYRSREASRSRRPHRQPGLPSPQKPGVLNCIKGIN